MDKSFTVKWPLFLPYSLPESSRQITLFHAHKQDPSKVNPTHNKMITFLQLALPNLCGLFLGVCSLKLLSFQEAIEKKNMVAESKPVPKHDFLSMVSRPEEKSVWARLFRGGDRRVTLCFVSFFAAGFLYGNTIYYLNVAHLADMYAFQE